MKKLLIAGAGGFGREVAGMVEHCIGAGEEFGFAGFVDDRADALEGYAGYGRVVGGMGREPREDEVYFCALGNVKARKACVERLKAAGAKFATLVDRRASVGRNVKIGEGCLVRAGAVLLADLELGAHTCVFDGAVVGHDSRVGEYSHLSAGVFLGGGTRAGEGVTFHPGAKVVPRLRIGDWATVGIGSVALVGVRDGATVFGVPATEV